MSRYATLGMGTVQWGMAYGIANCTGQPSGDEVGNMLRLAKQRGVMLLDTACTYGEAETRLGKMDAASQGFQIVTKIPPIRSEAISEKDIATVLAAFQESLHRLQCKQVYGLMVHHADNLLLPEAERLWSAMQDLKERGLAGRIGVSVYNPAQLEKVLDRFAIDLVQLPFNIYDQRFAQTGMLRRLRDNGVEVHSRSAFLQGLLLLTPELLPAYFNPIRSLHADWQRRASKDGLSPRDACLRFCLGHADIDKVIVGCETTQQLNEITDFAEKVEEGLSWGESCAIYDESIINPSRWPG